MTCGFRFGVMVAILTGFGRKRDTSFSPGKCLKTTWRRSPFAPRIYPVPKRFPTKFAFHPMLKMHLCLYPYNLDSFNIIHERETLFHIFYFLLFTFSPSPLAILILWKWRKRGDGPQIIKMDLLLFYIMYIIKSNTYISFICQVCNQCRVDE